MVRGYVPCGARTSLRDNDAEMARLGCLQHQRGDNAGNAVQQYCAAVLDEGVADVGDAGPGAETHTGEPLPTAEKLFLTGREVLHVFSGSIFCR